MLGRPVLTQAQLNQYVPQLQAQDIIWAPLYDSGNYSSGGQTSLQFFAVPQGQGTTTAPGATGTKSIADTNLQSAGQLTLGNAFYMTGQEVMLFPGVYPDTLLATGSVTTGANKDFVNDVYEFAKNGTLTLTVGSNRIYLQDGPLQLFPPATRLAVATALAGVLTTTGDVVQGNYAVASGEQYSIVPIYLQANLGFQEVLTWPAADALPSGVAARVFLRMRGYLNRNAQ